MYSDDIEKSRSLLNEYDNLFCKAPINGISVMFSTIQQNPSDQNGALRPNSRAAMLCVEQIVRTLYGTNEVQA